MNPIERKREERVRPGHARDMRPNEGLTESRWNSLDAYRDKLEMVFRERCKRPRDLFPKPVRLLLPRFRSMSMSSPRDLQTRHDPRFLRQTAFNDNVGDVDAERHRTQDRSDLCKD